MDSTRRSAEDEEEPRTSDTDAREEDQDTAPPGPGQPMSARMLRKARRRQANLARTLPQLGLTTERENLPAESRSAPVPSLPQMPTEEAAEREERIREIQRGLVRRRRFRALMLLARLMFFVVLPTLIVGVYYFSIASDMYETKSEFVIQKSETSNASPGGLGGLFSGFGLADAKDSIAVQGYLQSPAAMQRLDAQHGFIARFQDPEIDSIQRLAPDATRTEAYQLFQRNVLVGFDLTEGIIRMRVIAPDPASSEAYSLALISYAEQMVDSLSLRARDENMTGALKSFSDREEDVRAAANRVLELQQRYDTFSAEGELQIDLSVIQSQEIELEKLRQELDSISSNPKPNRAQMQDLRRRIDFTEKSIANRRAALTQSGEADLGLATISSQLQMAQSDLSAKEQMRIMALNTLEQARIQAARQVRYLSVNVPPVAPDVATYPRRAENTAVAFFIFLGIYIMVSLTVSILREQVSV